MGLYEEWLDLRARMAELKDRKDEVQAKLLAELGGNTAEVTYGGRALKLTPVAGERVVWDGPGIVGALSVPLRRRMTVQELDEKKFAAALASGELKQGDFEQFRTVEAIKPYIRVSTKA